MNDSPTTPPPLLQQDQPLSTAFREWFESARHKPVPLPADLQGVATRFRYVFVSGFHNEMMPLYFWGNLGELRRCGVPSKQLHRLHPSSHRPVEEAINWVVQAVEKLARQGPERLVVIAHSRGASIALASALRHAAWSREHVEALFLIQGPFGGTALADYVVGKHGDFPKDWPIHRVGLARSLTSIQRSILWLGWDSGLRDLTHEAARLFWAEELDRYAQAVAAQATRVDEIVHFVTSSIDPRRIRFPRSELGQILQEADGPNDGVVALADQSLEGFGARFEPLTAAHTDLVWGIYSSRAAKNDRRALIQAIVRALAVRLGEASAGSDIGVLPATT